MEQLDKLELAVAELDEAIDIADSSLIGARELRRLRRIIGTLEQIRSEQEEKAQGD